MDALAFNVNVLDKVVAKLSNETLCALIVHHELEPAVTESISRVYGIDVARWQRRLCKSDRAWARMMGSAMLHEFMATFKLPRTLMLRVLDVIASLLHYSQTEHLLLGGLWKGMLMLDDGGRGAGDWRWTHSMTVYSDMHKSGVLVVDDRNKELRATAAFEDWPDNVFVEGMTPRLGVLIAFLGRRFGQVHYYSQKSTAALVAALQGG